MIMLTTLAQAEEFYRRCIEKNATTLAERIVIAKEMQKERRFFPLTEEETKKRLKGKRVLRFKPK